MIDLVVLGGVALRRGPVEIGAVLAQPKRLGLLAYLAAEIAPPFHRRDALVALFWPELDAAGARRALRQSLYYLRRHLGESVLINRGAEEVAVNRDQLRCDAAALDGALREGRLAEGVALYRGDFLHGFFVAGAAPEFDAWVDRTRTRLRRAVARAAWGLADAEERAGNPVSSARWARRAAELDPGDEVSARRLIALLDRLGDHAGALETFDTLADRLQGDFGAQPSEETRALVAQVRRRRPTPPPGPSGPAVSGASAAPPSRSPSIRWRRPVRVLAAAAILMAVIGATLVWRAASVLVHPVVAVGTVKVAGAGASDSAGVVPDLLTAALGRVSGLEIVSRGRLYHVLSQLDLPETDANLRRAAARAGATELVEGELRPDSGTGVRLELRRVALGSGTTLGTVSVREASVLRALDAGVEELARDLGLGPPEWRLVESSPATLVARRFYDEGLRAFYQNDLTAARRLLDAALRQDSTLAMAAYYLVLTEAAGGAVPSRLSALWEQASRMADRAPEQERLFIKSAWANANMDATGRALADSLVARHPNLPDAHHQLGVATALAGDYAGSIPHFRRAFAMDSAAVARGGPRCVACDALGSLVNAYIQLDSLPAAEGVARMWTRLAPRVPAAWFGLGATLELQHRYAEALAAYGQAGEGYPPEQARLFALALAIRAGDFESADRGLRQMAGGAELRWRREAYWWLTISLRAQGRLREARVAARTFRALGDSASDAGWPRIGDAIPEAAVLLDAGRGREAAALFDSIARAPLFPTPTHLARHRAWHFTHKASALFLAGDTAALGPLADSIQMIGAQSGFGRDRYLHHYVRGLQLLAGGALADAVAEFRKNPIVYYGLADYRLAETLLATGRPREAIAVARRVLRGPLEAGNLYVNVTEVRRLLARAYELAGMPDSAAAEARRVAAAWRRADREVALRLARFESRRDDEP